jgi:hypothetical protein
MKVNQTVLPHRRRSCRGFVAGAMPSVRCGDVDLRVRIFAPGLRSGAPAFSAALELPWSGRQGTLS